MTIRSIVVGFDGSVTSHRALAMAAGLAGREHGLVHACFVAHLPATAALGGLVAPVPLLCDPEGDGKLAGDVTEELARVGVRGDFTQLRRLDGLVSFDRLDAKIAGLPVTRREP